ncbi:MAG TPA: SelL-related redox protein [Saprospiraceae bacterium]|nr:SelL-related redox protein [Saprospiraceae bacterium]
MEKLSFLHQIYTQRGESLWDLSYKQPVLIVFLRHFGCVFCKEAMTELGKKWEQIKAQNTHLVLVHLADPATAESFFEQYNLSDVDYVTDPDGLVYQQFGLLKATLQQMMGLKVWLRTFQQGVLQGHGLNSHVIGDGFQMPGAFQLYEGEIKEKFIHKSIADQPDYIKLADCLSCRPS